MREREREGEKERHKALFSLLNGEELPHGTDSVLRSPNATDLRDSEGLDES